MIVEDIVHPSPLRASARQAPLGPHIDDILASMVTVGYKAGSVRQLMQGLIRFGEYMRGQGIVDLNQLHFDHVESFVDHQPFRLFRARYRIRNSCVWAANYLWRYTCNAGITAPNRQPPAPVCSPLLEEWLEFLERHRGLAPGSLKQYRRHIHRFLQSLDSHCTKTCLAQVDVDYIREYVDQACSGRSRTERKTILSTLRNFLRFAWSRGYTSRDLSLAVGRVPTFKHDHLPRGPAWEDAKRLLDIPNCTTAVGRRDYAIMQLLLTYGVRAQQICALSIEDISWRRDTLTFMPLKGGRRIEV
jgi:integrase/recombinase XerD